MADDLDAVECRVEGHTVADVAVHDLDADTLELVQHRGRVPVHVGAQGVEDADLVAVGQGTADDRRADEARSARDEQAAHAWSPSRSMTLALAVAMTLALAVAGTSSRGA